MINIPENIQYTKSHEWADTSSSDKAVIGISDFAQREMGDIVFFNLPEVGDELTADEPFADMESVKAVADIIAPVSGIVSAVNEALFDEPNLVNEDPYGSWLAEVSPYEADGELLDAAAYALIAVEEA